MRSLGADQIAFDLIVASGPNSALPHHRSGERRLKKGDAVVLDFGCTYRLYRSDMTRTVFLGRAGGEFLKIYRIVERAQKAGLSRVCAGVAAGDVDRASRSVIEGAGYGPQFIHSTGHGVGLDIHEPPRVGPKSAQKLRPGMVITVEPGVYISTKFQKKLS